MVSVSLNKLGKKFGREWIFRNLSVDINPGDKLVVLGGNGSGKTTLLQIISGFVMPNEGSVVYTQEKKTIPTDEAKNFISYASPYLQLIEDFTPEEMVTHAAMYKPFLNQLSVDEALRTMELDHARGKYIRQFSSGMKQRLKLGMAILADTPLLLLDEPVSNLDRKAIEWYRELIQAHTNERTVIVCSNAIKEEFDFCTKTLDVTNYKVPAASAK